MILFPPFGTIENSITMMKHEHQNEGEKIEKTSELSHNYILLTNTCNTYRLIFEF